MGQFEYTDLNKFFVSIGTFLIGLTFFLPWLFFRENFDLLIKTTDLKTYTETAQNIIIQRQLFVSYFPIAILIMSLCAFLSGIFLCIKGIAGWYKADKLRQKAEQISNQLSNKRVLDYKRTENVSAEINEIVKEKEIIPDTLELVSNETETINSIEIPIDNSWRLNHWGSDVASIKNGKMIFAGLKTRLGSDGSHIDLKDILKVGSFYKVTCFQKALNPNTNGKFQLWCHDDIGIEPKGSSAAILYATPSVEGERCSLRFEAKYNTNIRVHLQYEPGEGQIEVSDVRIAELFNE
jgi:hypothetical protein